MDEIKIRDYLFKLKELSDGILKSFYTEQGLENTYPDLVYEYRSVRAELFLEIAGNRKLPRVNDPQLRNELKNFLKKGSEIVSQFKSSDKEAFHEIGALLEKDLKPEFSPEREIQLEWDLLYEWFNPGLYVYELIKTAPIIIKNLVLPEQLEPLIFELRQCIAFQNYLAAGIMLRTISDVAVKDIMERNYPIEANERDSDGYLVLNTLGKRLSFLEEKSFPVEARALNYLRKDFNDYVHGNKLINSDRVKQYVNIVLEQVERLYEKSDI